MKALPFSSISLFVYLLMVGCEDEPAWDLILAGTLNQKHDSEIRLIQNGDILEGEFVYLNETGRKISLRGVQEESFLRLEEYSGDQNRLTGIFEGNFDGTTYQGYWRDPAQKNRVTFSYVRRPQQKKKETVTTRQRGKIKSGNCKEIFEKTTGTECRLCKMADLGDVQVLAALQDFQEPHEDVIKDQLYLLEKREEEWQKIRQRTIPIEEYWYRINEDFDIEVVGNDRYYVFLSRTSSPQGTAFHGGLSADFILFDPDNSRFHIMAYEGKVVNDEKTGKSQVDGMLMDPDGLNSNPEVKDILMERYLISPLIYQKTAEDLDINSGKNYAEKWVRDNPDIYGIRWEGSTDRTKLKVSYYSEKDAKHFLSDQDKVIDNKDFKVYSDLPGQ